VDSASGGDRSTVCRLLCCFAQHVLPFVLRCPARSRSTSAHAKLTRTLSPNLSEVGKAPMGTIRRMKRLRTPTAGGATAQHVTKDRRR
jgi:hypothetical protein